MQQFLLEYYSIAVVSTWRFHYICRLALVEVMLVFRDEEETKGVNKPHLLTFGSGSLHWLAKETTNSYILGCRICRPSESSSVLTVELPP